MKKIMTEEQMVSLLDSLYVKALDGIPKLSESVEELTYDYTSKYSDVGSAANALINNQIIKCGTSGFLSGLGGALTLAVTLPANVTSVLYVQLRMVAAIARMGGYDIRSDMVKTMVYACLAGSAMADVLKAAGIKIGNKMAVAALKKLPGKVFIEINKKVGFRLLTKFGEKGIINVVKLVPLAGGVVGGAFDVTTTKIIAANAYKMFIENEIPE